MPRRKSVKPSFEILEDRLAPARYVTRLTDSGVNGFEGELRTEITRAAPNDEIRIVTAAGIRLERGPLDINKNLTIIGMPGTTIYGTSSQGASDRAMIIFAPNATVSVTITGIKFEECRPAEGVGGAILARGNLILNSCTFERNIAPDAGGAVDFRPFDSSSTIAITGCTFSDNRAPSGGAVNIEAIGANEELAAAAVSISGSAFRRNRATVNSGGAIEADGTQQTLVVTDSEFVDNYAKTGGGAIFSATKIFQVASTAGNRSAFNGNNAGFVGGAISYSLAEDNTQNKAASFLDVVFSGNGARYGGAMYIEMYDGATAASTAITGCLFVGNQAAVAPGDAQSGKGAGLYFFWQNTTEPPRGSISTTITNTTFYQNSAGRDGGGIYIQNWADSTATAVLTSLTVNQNRAIQNGGGVAFVKNAGAAKPQVRNSIFAENTGNTKDVFGDVASYGFNLIGVSNGSTGWNVGGPIPDQIGDANAPLTAGLGNLEDNGGPTYTLAVPNTSLAYRTGDADLQNAAAPLTLDQRGRTRNGIDGNCAAVVSVGAYEPDSAGSDTVNHFPIGANNTVSTPEDRPYTFALSDFSFTDPNDDPANNFRGLIITDLPTYGYLAVNGSRLSYLGQGIFVRAADIAGGGLQFYPNGGNGTAYASFTFRVQDDGGTINEGEDTDTTDRTITIDVTRVNHAPRGADNAISTLKNTSYVFAAADFGFSDPDEVSADALYAVKITTLPTAGTLTNNSSAVSAGDFISIGDINSGYLSFAPASNATGSPYATMTFQVQDDGGTSNGGVNLDPVARTMTINVKDTTFVNHAPVGTANTVTTLENTAYVFDAADFGFTDPNDSPANSFLAVQITSLPGAGILTNNGLAVSANGWVNVSDIDDGLLVFTPAVNAGGTAYTSFNFKVRDDAGTANSGANTDTTARTMTINVTMVNQPPTGEDNTVTTLENTDYVFDPTDFGFDDPNESSADAFAGVKITGLPMFGTLKLDGTPVEAGDIISYSDIDDGPLTFTPEVNISGNLYDGFLFQVQDDGGTSGGGVDLDPVLRVMNINVTWVNQAPEGADNTLTALEDTPLTLTAADFGFSDPDDAPGNWFDSVKITTLPSDGTLTLEGMNVSANDFISLQDIFDGKLVFTPDNNDNGSDYATIGFKVKDDGGTDNGGVDLDGTERTLTIDVTAVNDAPLGTDNHVIISQNQTYTFDAADFGFGDVDGDGFYAVIITALPNAGTLLLNGNAVSANQVISVDDLDDLTYTPPTNATGWDVGHFTFKVQDDGGTANGGVDTDPIANTITFDVI